MKRIYLSLLIALSCTPIFSQVLSQSNQVLDNYPYLREGWQGTIGGGAGFCDGGEMAFTLDGELGKHITPKFYVGGGITVDYCEAMSMGLCVSPRYYYSKELNSFYVEASLGLTLLGGKYDVYESEWYDKREGPTTGIAVGYVFDEKLSFELGVNCFVGQHYDSDKSSSPGSLDYSHLYSFVDCHIMLKVNYTFDLGGESF